MPEQMGEIGIHGHGHIGLSVKCPLDDQGRLLRGINSNDRLRILVDELHAQSRLPEGRTDPRVRFQTLIEIQQNIIEHLRILKDIFQILFFKSGSDRLQVLFGNRHRFDPGPVEFSHNPDHGFPVRFPGVVQHGTVFHGRGGHLLKSGQIVVNSGALEIKGHPGQISQLPVQHPHLFNPGFCRLFSKPLINKAQVGHGINGKPLHFEGLNIEPLPRNLDGVQRLCHKIGPHVGFQQAGPLLNYLGKIHAHGNGNIRKPSHPRIQVIFHHLRQDQGIGQPMGNVIDPA